MVAQTRVVAEDMERRSWRLNILNVEPTKLPDRLDTGYEKKRRLWDNSKACGARKRRLPSSEMGKVQGQQAEVWREIRSLVLDVWGL